MKRRYAVFAIVLAVSMLIGIQAIEVANANPGFTLPTRTSPPDALVVSIKVLSPKENATYTTDTINVCFTKEVNSLPGMATYVHIISTYQGDWMNSNKWCPFPPGADPAHWNSFQVLQHNFTLTQVPEGYHTLTIDASGQGNYNVNGTEYDFGLYKKVDVHFYIHSKDNQTSSPTPSQSMPSNNISPTLPVWLNSSIVYIVLAIGIAIVAVASIALVYFNRRKGKP
jgi:hypothetical protein